MKKNLSVAILLGSIIALSSPALATDHHYPDTNSYFSSKYHHRHSHHWQNDKHRQTDKAKHWGKHHHHGIHLDGHDGRP